MLTTTPLTLVPNGNAGLDGGLDGQVARYDYSFGDFAVAISAEIGANTEVFATGTGNDCHCCL